MEKKAGEKNAERKKTSRSKRRMWNMRRNGKKMRRESTRKTRGSKGRRSRRSEEKAQKRERRSKRIRREKTGR